MDMLAIELFDQMTIYYKLLIKIIWFTWYIILMP